MVYCKLISVTNRIVRYAIDGYVNDITEELILHRETNEYEVIKVHKNRKSNRTHIECMLRKHFKEFQKGIFKEKIAYEI